MGSKYRDFPTLEINPKDVFGSWKLFLDRFTVAVRFEICNRGTKKVTIESVERDVNVFNEEMKLCALLKAISNEGFQALQAQGIDLSSEDLTYDQVLKALKNAYEREESLNVKLWNFNSACQQSSEDCRDYVRRVEHLSRTTGIFKSTVDTFSANEKKCANQELERIRKTLAQIIVVNGLQDLKLRRELMAKNDLDWESLCSILSCRGTAAESDQKLERTSIIVPAVPIKQEVAEARYDSKYSHRDSRSRDRHDSRDRKSNSRNDSRGRSRDRRDRSKSKDKDGRKTQASSGLNHCYQCSDPHHRIRNCPHATCHLCQKKGHTVMDCPSKSKSSSSDQPKSLRSREPSPYPDRGRTTSPNQYMQIRRVNVDPDKLFGHS